MKIGFRHLFLLFVLIIVSLNFSSATAQIVRTKTAEKKSIEKLRNFYLNRDFDNGSNSGEKLIRQFPGDTELQAWYILNLANSGILEGGRNGVMYNPQTARAIELAKKNQTKFPNDAWANFALGQVYNIAQSFKDSVAAIDKALEIEPNNEEFIFARASYLSGLGKYDEMIAWLDKNSAKLNQPRLLNVKSLALLRQSDQFPNKREKLNEFFSQSLRLEPDNVNTNYLYAYWLNTDKQFDEAMPILKKAVLLSPGNIRIHQEFWTAILGQPNKTDGQKNEELARDIKYFLTATKNSPTALMTVLQKYEELKNEAKRNFYENLIVQKFPNTKYDETILFNRIFRIENEEYKKISEGSDKDSASKQEMESMSRKINEMRWNFIKRDRHFDESNLGYVYLRLLREIGSTKETTDNQLTELIKGSLKYSKSNNSSINSTIARILIDLKASRPNSKLNQDAEKYAREGIVEAENKIKLLKPGESEGVVKSLRGQSLNTLGYVLVHEVKLDEAEQVLLKAKQIEVGKAERFFVTAMREDTDNNLAQLYTVKKDYEKAEEYYLMNAVDDESARKAFAEFYEKRYGNKDGFDDYYIRIRRKIKERSRERIIASRIQNPPDASSFSLKTIDDKTISLADLKGKIVIINVWGTWCAPCVGEMPQLQQFYKKYENDKDVAVITMDVNDELETVKKFIAAKKYEFPVLLGDSYIKNIIFEGSTAFPTTLFIDKQGKVSFVKVGDSDNLLEEYDWRIEALKQDK